MVYNKNTIYKNFCFNRKKVDSNSQDEYLQLLPTDHPSSYLPSVPLVAPPQPAHPEPGFQQTSNYFSSLSWYSG